MLAYESAVKATLKVTTHMNVASNKVKTAVKEKVTVLKDKVKSFLTNKTTRVTV